MKHGSAVTYGLGALFAHVLFATEAATLRGGNVNTNANNQAEANPQQHRRRLVDSTTCTKSTLVEVQYEDLSNESFISCETSNGMQYKLKGVPQETVHNNGRAIANGQVTFDFPAGTIINDSTAEIEMPHGSEVKFKKKTNDNNSIKRKRGHIQQPSHDRKLQQDGGIIGTRSILVVKVIAGDGTTTAHSQDRISDSVFGNGADGSADTVTLKSQYNVCSYNQLNFVEAPDQKNEKGVIANGSTTISVSTQPSEGDKVMANAVTNALNSAFGVESPNELADLVMYCLPPRTMSGIAYAYANEWLSVYKNKWCTYLSAQMHEIGHNLGLDHSNESGTYKDNTGMMGYSYSEYNGPLMCFNGAKSWQLGWYKDKHVVFNVVDGSWSGKLVGHVHKKSAIDEKVILKLNTQSDTDYYVSFNCNADHNSGTVEGGNQVTIQRMGGEGNEYAASELVAKLNAGGEYVINNFDNSGLPLTLRVNNINTAGSLQYPPYADISVGLKCGANADCDDGLACNGVETCSAGFCAPGKAAAPQKVIEIAVKTDTYPVETSWTLVNAARRMIGSQHSYGNGGTMYSHSYTVCEDEFTFTVNDSANDGLCCKYGSGSYTVKYGGVEVASGGAFGSTTSHTFGSSQPSPTPPPTKFPTKSPVTPTPPPTDNPTTSPTTASPTTSKLPSKAPTSSPTNKPTVSPTTGKPTTLPTRRPTNPPIGSDCGTITSGGTCNRRAGCRWNKGSCVGN